LELGTWNCSVPGILLALWKVPNHENPY